MVNSVVIMGRLTYEPELRATPNGVSVVRFQIVANNVSFCGSKAENSNSNSAVGYTPDVNSDFEEIADDDLPF